MRSVIAVACAALLAAASARGAEAIIRCESTDGRVTYSNGECPPNTKQVRRVELSPPIVVHDGAQSPAKSPAPRSAPAIAPAPPRRARDPAQEDRELTAQLAEQRRECEARA